MNNTENKFDVANSGLTFLNNYELKSINGGNGFWKRFWPAYIVKEIIEGIQAGLSADCEEVC